MASPPGPHMRPARVLVVDDVAGNVQLLSRLLAREGYEVRAASSGEGALAALAEALPDVIVSDVMMPGMTGLELCRRVKQMPATRLIPFVLVTALHERADRIEGIVAGADDFLSKPVDAVELAARVRSLVALKRHTDDLESAEAVIMSLALTIEARDPYTHGHCRRLASIAGALGRRLGLRDDDVAALERGGFLHDIGKIAVPDAVLMKPSALDAAEFAQMKQHTVVGDALCGQLRSLSHVRPIVRHHHERLDGSGYPDALRGDAIPLLAHIMSIVDVYDALTTARPYRTALARDQALEELRAEVRHGWRRADLVDEFVALANDPGFTWSDDD